MLITVRITSGKPAIKIKIDDSATLAELLTRFINAFYKKYGESLDYVGLPLSYQRGGEFQPDGESKPLTIHDLSRSLRDLRITDGFRIFGCTVCEHSYQDLSLARLLVFAVEDQDEDLLAA